MGRVLGTGEPPKLATLRSTRRLPAMWLKTQNANSLADNLFRNVVNWIATRDGTTGMYFGKCSGLAHREIWFRLPASPQLD
jgi:hypothetical protein